MVSLFIQVGKYTKTQGRAVVGVGCRGTPHNDSENKILTDIGKISLTGLFWDLRRTLESHVWIIIPHVWIIIPHVQSDARIFGVDWTPQLCVKCALLLACREILILLVFYCCWGVPAHPSNSKILAKSKFHGTLGEARILHRAGVFSLPQICARRIARVEL